MNKLEKKCHDKNIVFISISVDKNSEKWRKMVKENEMGGIQLISDKGMDSDFMKAYGIRGIPRFVLINPEGNIILSNAPRPSHERDIMKLFKDSGI